MQKRRRHSRAVPVLALLVVTAAATACEDEEPEPDTGLDYAALGDSYTAAPYLPNSSTDGCFRSDRNYPHQVAEELPDVELVDVSCGGATTEAILQSQETDSGVHPAQIEAVSADTDIVTVGLGVNDLSFPNTAVLDCVLLAEAFSRGSPCEDANGRKIPRILERTHDRLVEVLDAITNRAPNARVLVVGYPLLFDGSKGCPQRIPIAPGDVDFVRESYEQLNETVESAASEAGVEYVDVAAASEGHDICAEDPWIQGDRQSRRTKAAAFHPTPAEQAAVAELVLALL